MSYGEPCLCGATDCRSCYPGTWNLVTNCRVCGDDLVDGENLVDLDDEVCMRCKGWVECPVCKGLAHPDDGFAETCGHPDAAPNRKEATP